MFLQVVTHTLTILTRVMVVVKVVLMAILKGLKSMVPATMVDPLVSTKTGYKRETERLDIHQAMAMAEAVDTDRR